MTVCSHIDVGPRWKPIPRHSNQTRLWTALVRRAQVAQDTTERLADSFEAESSALHKIARSLVVTVRKRLVMQNQTGWEAELQSALP